MSPGKSVLAIAAFAGGLAASPGVLAQDRGAYLGGALGQAKVTDWCDTSGAPAGASLPACEDTDTAWKVFGGYRFNRYLAVEGTYVNWGTVTGTVQLANGSRTDVSAEQTSLGVAAVGSFEFTPQFGVFGKAGFLSTDQEARAASTTTDGSDTEFHYGLGLRFAFTPNWVARAEWEKTDKLKVEMMSLGVEYRF
jgi:opacity protein-like surface antigen